MDLAVREGEAVLLVIDVQERLAPAMNPELLDRLLTNLERLGGARAVLDLPVVISEQYPKGLGPTLPRVRAAFEGVEPLEKLCFSATGDATIAEAIRSTGKKTVIVAGMETHVCVYQTVRDLAKAHRVHVLRDGVASRTRENFEVGLSLMERAGGIVTSTEVVLFDLLQKAGTEAFRTVSKLVR